MPAPEQGPLRLPHHQAVAVTVTVPGITPEVPGTQVVWSTMLETQNQALGVAIFVLGARVTTPQRTYRPRAGFPFYGSTVSLYTPVTGPLSHDSPDKLVTGDRQHLGVCKPGHRHFLNGPHGFLPSPSGTNAVCQGHAHN